MIFLPVWHSWVFNHEYLNLENKPTATQGLTPDIEVSIETAGQNFFFLLFFWLPTRISIDHLSTVTLN